MTLQKHEKALIRSYRKINRTKKQLVWILIKDGMHQQGLRIFFNH